MNCQLALNSAIVATILVASVALAFDFPDSEANSTTGTVAVRAILDDPDPIGNRIDFAFETRSARPLDP
jgi:hypothetical protein